MSPQHRIVGKHHIRWQVIALGFTLATAAAGQTQATAKQQARAEADAQVCAQSTGSPPLDIITCTRALNIGRHSPLTTSALYAARGHAYRLTGRIESAITDHTAAIAANPLSADAYMGRGLALADAGKLKAAADDLATSVALFPNFAFAWKHLGRVKFLLGDEAGAKKNLARALAINPADGEAFAIQAFIAYREGRFDDAIVLFRTSERRQLGYAYTGLWICLAAQRLGINDDKSALHAALDGLADDDQWPGIVYKHYLGQASADEVLRESRALHGPAGTARHAQAAFYLGQLAQLRGETARADEWFTTVRKLAGADAIERVMLH